MSCFTAFIVSIIQAYPFKLLISHLYKEEEGGSQSYLNAKFDRVKNLQNNFAYSKQKITDHGQMTSSRKIKSCYVESLINFAFPFSSSSVSILKIKHK